LFERFTERARQVVVLAQDEARSMGHGYIGTEHLLLGLFREREGLAAAALASLGITLEDARDQVSRVVGQGPGASSGQIPFTPRAKKALELSLQEARALDQSFIGTEHLLLALCRVNDGVAARILLDFDADVESVQAAVQAVLAGAPRSSRRPVRDWRRSAAWQYRIEWLADESALTVEWLDDIGSEGWELVSLSRGEPLRAIFKRRAPRRGGDLA
jgi:ATP-dependent Clp protease ATP-binding subunit ClpC